VQQAIQYSTAVLGSGAFSHAGREQALSAAVVETEGVRPDPSMTTDVHEGATSSGGQARSVPGIARNKIGMTSSLLVPKAELKTRRGRREFSSTWT